MKVSYHSLGCKVNLYESEAIVNQFIDNGFELGDFNDECDVYIINTCSVTSVSDSKSRKIIRQAIKRNENAIVAVMGCYAQLKPEDIKEIEGVDVLVGTNNRHLLYPMVMKTIESKHGNIIVEDILSVKEYEEVKINRYNNKTRGFVKIQDGCDNYCSYCTIPYARGHVRSRKQEDVISEIQTLTDHGMKEIILTGINTASYGSDFEGYEFADLLQDIVKQVKSQFRLRISSIEVTEITDKLIKVIKENEQNFCRHFHIPLQGGADSTLKRMYRKYDLKFYEEKINKLRQNFPDVNITTDIMVGFSGETDQDYNDTLDFVRKIKFGDIHVFPYSRRPETKAYNFPNIVNNVTKQFRVNKLINLCEEEALKCREFYVGKIVDVIIEKVHNNIAFGHSSEYLEVTFKGDVKQNDLVKVEITEAGYPLSKGVLV
jgi:threonylcarbamoyladenosine tRNA methylthiotransferase MtaB